MLHVSCISKELQLFTTCSKTAQIRDYTAPTSFTLSKGENIAASFQLITHRVSIVIVEFHFIEIIRANKYYYTACKCCLCICTKLNFLIIHRYS